MIFIFISEATFKSSGGTICPHGCAIEFSPHSVESECTVKIHISNESSSVPEENHVISPTLTLDANNVNMAEVGEVFGEITTWCYADDATQVDLLRRTYRAQGWVKFGTFSLRRQRKHRFKIEEIESSEWLIAFHPTPEATRVLKYRVYAYLYRGKPSEFLSYYCIDDDFALSRVEQYINTKGLTSAIMRRDPLVVKIADIVTCRMSCADECPECIFTGGGGFEFSGVFKSKCFGIIKFQLVQVSASHKAKPSRLIFRIRKNDIVMKEVKLEAEWPSTSEARANQPGEGHPERPALQDTDFRENNLIIQSLCHDIEENIRTPRKTRGQIGSNGGTIGICGCSLKFAPGSFDENTPVELIVNSHAPLPNEDYVAFTPMINCMLFGAQPKNPVEVELPTYCLPENDEKVVVLGNKVHSDNWKEICDAVLNIENQTVEFQIRHFCGFVGGIIKKVVVSLKKSLSVSSTLYLSWYYKPTSFIAVIYLGGKKNEDDCTEAFKKPGIVRVSDSAHPFVVNFEDRVLLKLRCSVPLKPPETSIKSLEDLLKTKYDVSYFVLPRTLMPHECLPYITFSIKRNDHVEEKVLPSPWRVPAALQSHPTADVAEFNLKLAERFDYDTHLGDENKYRISRQKAKGKVLILNNYFADDQVAARVGSEVDIHNMTTLWERIGLSVTTETNMSSERMRSIVKSFAENIGEVSLCVVIVMSHGTIEGGRDAIMCEDNEVVLFEEIFRQFDDDICRHLRGVPKLYFMQCCRGERVLRRDVAEARVEPGPVERGEPPNDDRLIAYATQRTYAAFRNEEQGGWFINAITNVFMNNAYNMSVSDMMNLVNNAVSQRRGNIRNPEELPDCQMSESVSTLRKVLLLFPGWPEIQPAQA